METVIEKTTAYHNVAIEKVSKNIKLQQYYKLQLISSQKKKKRYGRNTLLILKFSNTLKQPKEAVNTGGYNVPDGVTENFPNP